MKNDNEVEKYLHNKENLEKLLLLEKKRRGIAKDNICFVATANIAGYWYCGMKSYYRSKRDELMFFQVYLTDRIRYSEKLGLIKDLPEDKGKWLNIGDEITFEDINKLLEERKKYVIEYVNDKDAENIKDKFEKGRIYQYKLAENYPSIRWNFRWDKYVIIAMPDGITDDFVYEFKSTASRFLLFFIKPVALTQADLYGYFYNRKNKRVQIYLEDERKVEIFEDKVDINRVLNTLRLFKKVEINKKAIKPRKKWKCNNCEFKNICILVNDVENIKWQCRDCKYIWKGKPYKYRQRKFKCPRCGNWPVYPGTKDKSWFEIASLARKRDKYRCVECGSKENLEVHHIIPISDGGSSELNNLKTLCVKCHTKKHPLSCMLLIVIGIFLIMFLILILLRMF